MAQSSSPSSANALMLFAAAKSTLESIGTNPIDREHEDEVKGEESDAIVSDTAVMLLAGASLVAVTISFFNFYVMENPIIDAAAIWVFVFAPAILWQKYQLSELKNFRQVHSDLRTGVSLLGEENDRMHGTIAKLEQHTRKLHQVENELAKTAKKSGTQVNKLIKITTEMADVQAKMREKLQKTVVLNIMSAILRADTDGSFSLSGNELDQLKIRLHSLDPQVEFHPHNFDKYVMETGKPGTLQIHEVCAITSSLNQDIADPKMAVFTFKPKLTKKHSKNGRKRR